MNRRNQTTWFLMHLVPVCSEEQTKTRTLPLLLGWLQRPLLLLERIVVEELLPVQRGESQPVYFDCSEAEKVHKGAKVFLNSYFRLTTLWFHEKIYETVDLVLLFWITFGIQKNIVKLLWYKNLKLTLAPFLRRGRRGDSKQRARFVCRLLVLAAFTSQAVTKFFGLTKRRIMS